MQKRPAFLVRRSVRPEGLGSNRSGGRLEGCHQLQELENPGAWWAHLGGGRTAGGPEGCWVCLFVCSRCTVDICDNSRGKDDGENLEEGSEEGRLGVHAGLNKGFSSQAANEHVDFRLSA